MRIITTPLYRTNSALDFIIAAAALLLLILIATLLKRIIFRKMEAHTPYTRSEFDDLMRGVIGRYILPVTYLFLGYLVFTRLDFSGLVNTWAERIFLLLTTLLITSGLIKIVSFLFVRYLTKAAKQDSVKKKYKGLLAFVRMVLWLLALLFILDNFGLKVTAVITGLGIGGVALALASQAILGDLFNYFAIMLDEPFIEGDFIVFGSTMGTIESIGIKSIRIRSIGGEQIIVSNTDLSRQVIFNYKRMQERRVVFKVGIVYETPVGQIEGVSSILRQAVESVPLTRFDRSNFISFGNSSLDFETVYYVLTPDYNKYIDIQEKINLVIIREFQRQGIVFAYPTRVVMLKKNETS